MAHNDIQHGGYRPGEAADVEVEGVPYVSKPSKYGMEISVQGVCAFKIVFSVLNDVPQEEDNRN